MSPTQINVPNPTVDNSPTHNSVGRTVGNYDARVYNEQVSKEGYARAEVRLRILTTGTISSDVIWDLEIILARAECGLSRPLDDDGVVTASGLQSTPNASRADVLNAESDDGQDNEDDEDRTPTEDETRNSRVTSSELPNPEEETTTQTSNSRRSGTPSSTMAQSRVPTTSSTAATSTPRTKTQSPTPSSSTTPKTPRTTVPAIVIPDEPGELSPTARIEDVDTITVGEDELDVVVVGDEVPTDARGGAAALEIWLGGGSPSSTWETFASDDPDADGWRWAAINQKTGTIVYIV